MANPRNWRVHPRRQQEAVAGLIEQVGWVQDVIVNRRTGHIVDGHLRVTLALERRELVVPVVYVDLTPAEEDLVLAALDPLAALAVTDKEMHEKLIADVYAEGTLADVLGLGPKAGLTDPEDAPLVRADPHVKRGELYALGPHRLMCGDATSDDDMARLMGGERARMIWTDPPYGVEYVGGTAEALTIEGDTAGDTDPLLRAAFAAADPHLVDGGAIYIAAPGGRRGIPFLLAFVDAPNWLLHQELVWVKNALVIGHSDYQHQHEKILYGWRGGAPRDWWGWRNQSTVIDDETPVEELTLEQLQVLERRRREAANSDVVREKRPTVSALHPTMKPVALVRRMVQNSSARGELVLDMFAGSGSTLIAAQQLGRTCALMEIDPQYAQVTIERWERFTGQTARLELAA